jgi:hypothetical protein
MKTLVKLSLATVMALFIAMGAYGQSEEGTLNYSSEAYVSISVTDSEASFAYNNGAPVGTADNIHMLDIDSNTGWSLSMQADAAYMNIETAPDLFETDPTEQVPVSVFSCSTVTDNITGGTLSNSLVPMGTSASDKDVVVTWTCNAASIDPTPGNYQTTVTYTVAVSP